MKTIILSIGDELILGQVADTNSACLSSRLVEHGIVPEYHQTVPDDLEAIAGAVKNAAGHADLIIVTGGLGPTKDDLTRQAIAGVLNVPLALHKPSLVALKRFFKQRGRVMSASNRIQALFPRGARVLDNPIGTAPGFAVTIGRNFNVAKQVGRGVPAEPSESWMPRRGIPTLTIIVLPGVPREMKLMFERHVAPLLKKKTRNAVLTRRINVFGMGESLVGEKLGALMRRGRNPLVGTTASGGIISVRLRGEFKNARKGALEMSRLVAVIKRMLGDYVFSEGEVSLSEAVGKMLISRRKTLATAESCTAGMLGALVTEAPGASRYYLGGWIVYANEMKAKSLSVPEELIAREGAVSEAVAKKMAEGALLKSGADYALAITGIAGPAGGTPQKPVGTVWIALAEKIAGGIKTGAEKYCFGGERAFIRELAAKRALNILRLRLLRD